MNPHDKKFLRLALEQAKESVKKGGFPAGAVVVKDGKIISKGYYEGRTNVNKLNEENNRKIELVFIPDFEAESLTLIEEWESQSQI